ncbi:MAG: DUF3082 domain-containing protein [Leptolyngbyaceae cyanobacterium SL_7_1]|nr:DUF3082 domain-containing protein [Leptolyngbyaceae cyanobacterium SL_7_1]
MVNPTPTPNSAASNTIVGSAKDANQPTPLRCLTGAIISGALGTALYFLTVSIHSTFANKPLPTTNELAVKISIAVRTLVVGMSALGTTIFWMATLGLIALAIQLLIKDMMGHKNPSVEQ